MIYFIAEGLSWLDGASRSAEDFLRHLLELHRDVIVVSRTRYGPAESSEEMPTGRVRWLAPPSSAPALPGVAVSARNWLGWGAALLRYGEGRLQASIMPWRFPPTLAIHNAFPVPNSYGTGLLGMSQRRLIVVHSSPTTVAQFLRKRTYTTSWVAEQLATANALVFVSPQIRESWGRIADIARIPQWVLPNTCREDDAAAVLKMSRSELRASLGLPKESLIVICVGYVHRGKGQDVLVDALPEMLATGKKLLLVFVGNDTAAWAAELKDKISQRGLSDYTCFKGLRKDAYALIRAADLMIHPSRAEGQGLVLLEAMLLGTPVLATDVDGIPSTITHAESGWLVRPDDPHALAVAFRTLVENEDVCRRLAEQAQQVYWREFSRREYRTRFQAMFQTLFADIGR
jgi:glycosyltransferase involved in cell wall biosynthesis